MIFFNLYVGEISKNIKRLQNASNYVAILDVLTTFAQVAEDNKYIKPEINTNGIIEIKDGRHPVVEQMLERR